MIDRDRDLLHRLDSLHNEITTLRLEYAKNIIVEDFNDLLEFLERENEAFEIWIGYYGMEEFQLDEVLNDNTIYALIDFEGKTIVDYLLDYYKNNNTKIYMPSPPTVAIKIRVDSKELDTYYIEYDGYNLTWDLI